MSVLDLAKKELLRTCVTKPSRHEVAQVTKENYVELAELMNLMRAGSGDMIRATYYSIEWYTPSRGLFVDAHFTHIYFGEWVFFYENGFSHISDEDFHKRYDLEESHHG